MPLAPVPTKIYYNDYKPTLNLYWTIFLNQNDYLLLSAFLIHVLDNNGRTLDVFARTLAKLIKMLQAISLVIWFLYYYLAA